MPTQEYKLLFIIVVSSYIQKSKFLAEGLLTQWLPGLCLSPQILDDYSSKS